MDICFLPLVVIPLLWCICADHSDLFRFPFDLYHFFLYWWWLPNAHVHNIPYLYFVSLPEMSTWQEAHFCWIAFHISDSGLVTDGPLSMICMFIIALLLMDLFLHSIYCCHCFVTVWLLWWHIGLTVALLLMCLSLPDIYVCHCPITAWLFPWHIVDKEIMIKSFCKKTT